jgi:hypothetical protein
MVDTVHKLPVKTESPGQNGWRPLQSLRHEVDRLFDAFDNISWRSPFSSREISPSARMTRSSHKIVVLIPSRDMRRACRSAAA